MVNVVINNVSSRIAGALHPDRQVAWGIGNELREKLGYYVPNYEYSPKYRAGTWDGMISLYNRREQSFPTGAIKHALDVLKENTISYKIIDERQKPEPNCSIVCDLSKHDRQLRPYQQEAVDSIRARGRGVVQVATGGGKTIISCKIMEVLGLLPVVFVVPSNTLMYQTCEEFEKYLTINGEPARVGKAGDGVCDINPDGINVVTWQTALGAFDLKYTPKGDKVEYDPYTGLKIRKSSKELASELETAEEALAESQKQASARHHKLLKADGSRSRAYISAISESTSKARGKRDQAKTALRDRLELIANKERVKDLFGRVNVFMVDEAHTAAVVIQTLGEQCPQAYYRIGMTATPWREDNQEIRIEGSFGRVCCDATPSRLIREGWLVPPKIFLIYIYHVEEAETYKEVYDKHVINCWQRNYRIKQAAEAFHKAGMPVMILVENKSHGDNLEAMIENAVFVPGDATWLESEDDDQRNYRREMLKKTGRNEQILIATQWANVGVDEPAIMVLILAGSGQSSVTTFQQVGRVLRPVGANAGQSAINGKPYAVVVDFYDEQADLRKHSYRRLRAYKLEEEFSITHIR